MKHKNVIGKLTSVPHADNGKTAYFFEKEDGEFLNIKFVASHKSIPYNKKIALCMSEEPFKGYYAVCTHKPFFTEIKE